MHFIHQTFLSIIALFAISLIFKMQKIESKPKALLNKIPQFTIDAEGTFKYIQVQCKDSTGSFVIFIRGHNVTFHKQLFEELMQQIGKAGLQVFGVVRILQNKVLQEFKINMDGQILSFRCLGGGRMVHSSNLKKLEVYGYSKTYGQKIKVKHDEAVDQAIKYLKYPANKIIISNKKY